MTGAMGAPAAVLGILAGGRGLRMGGCDKAQLLAPGGAETVLARLLRIGRELALHAVVLGGPARNGVLVLPDEPPGCGPIGGLRALLAHARGATVVALACDMPFVTAALLERLLHASSTAPVLAARDPQSGRWQPWFARYDAARVLGPLTSAIARQEHSMQRVLGSLGVEELMLAPSEHALLRDWDEPSDIAQGS